MKYLEANKLLGGPKKGLPMPLQLVMSGTPDQLQFYLRAHAAREGIDAEVRMLPFGTLGQYLNSTPPDIQEVGLLLPWDFAVECDWRLGMRAELTDIVALTMRAESVAATLAKRRRSHLVYVPSPIPPLCAAHSDTVRLASELTAIAAGVGATIIPGDSFSLATYLATGSPLDGTGLSRVAKTLVELLLASPPGKYKVIATDADNTLWAGLVGEDGVDGVSANPEGRAFRHFIYQGLLRRLKAAGILLAVISRNDEDMVRAPLNAGRMPLAAEDFVAIHAGYGAKSEQLRALAKGLNLSIDSIVFVDDNPVEIAEVSAAEPDMACLAFPASDDELPAFLNRLGILFDRTQVTAEDAERTEMYRRRSVARPELDGAGLVGYLKNLEMVLTICDRSKTDWTRAHQLINKTNQFNLNGERLAADEIKTILAQGGQMFTATLEDRTGNHGEILACLIEGAGRVRSFVMSCRVFQRQVEFAFLTWLLQRRKEPGLLLAFAPTERNEPLRSFLADQQTCTGPDGLILDGGRFLEANAQGITLFKVSSEVP